MHRNTLLFVLSSLVAWSVHATPTRRDTGTKNVFAHHMVGFTYSYTSKDWVEDVRAAHAAGIDGFALNVGTDSWQPTQVASAYQAAEQSGTGFKMFLSFDMSVFQCSSSSDAATLRSWVSKYATHANQFLYNGHIFVSTFAGESCTFGQSSVAQGWASQFTSQLAGSNAVHFVPSFFVDPSTFGQYSSSINGMFNFNSGWPISLTTATANAQLSSQGESLSATSPSDLEKITQVLLPNVGSIDTDNQYVSGLKSVTSNDGKAPTYMGAVSPWFFTHYSPQTFNKNAHSHLYNTRWENVVENRHLFDLIEICTWNDFSESHYIGLIHGSQPNSQAWVDGFDHSAWLNMTSYYATAYKTGSCPAITQDKICIWARPHPKKANAPDPVGKPSNFEMTQDLMWAVVFATLPATVTLWTSDSNSQTSNVQAGVTKLNMPLTETGGYMRAMLRRDGVVIMDFTPSGYHYEPNPSAYNYNAFTAGSPN
ncbi:hypothetical protein NM688_g3772 [Phlebia brevispora]|uniref:Uncharacterized protein n=1 Tax=Phlebia brevispora TaxID=194682 RepID=A0ACC1T5G5_9APHY|nr:hypothetical protein NM688_g3772 [Phlebia brevispora]